MQEVRWDIWALLQLIVFQMKLLSHLAPTDWIEEVVRATFEGAPFLDRLHPGSPAQPDFLLLVVTPVTVVQLVRRQQLQDVSSVRVEDVEKQFVLVALELQWGQFVSEIYKNIKILFIYCIQNRVRQ